MSLILLSIHCGPVAIRRGKSRPAGWQPDILFSMRGAGLTLVGLLVVIGIIALIQHVYTLPMVRQGQNVRQQAQQLAGQDQTGMRHTESITFSPAGDGRRFQGLKVDTVVAGGPMNAHFGLLPGDVVTGIVGMPDLGFISGDDPDTAAALVLEAYQRSQSLIVERPGVGKIELPRDAGKYSVQQQPLTATAPANSPAPANPQPQSAGPGERVPTFIDRLQGAGGE